MSHKLSRAEAAQRIRDIHRQPCTPETLATKAWNGSGPVYCLAAGKAYYDVGDIDRWARARISAPVRKAAEARRAKQAEPAAC
ncbi:MAG: hypothetical protein B7Y80_20735 [Hyphomicrobium sp. 32-62-53]|jgi:hypothetical protein|nr:MAG: hypothetical protein B7Y80_20735 [Hyphomicrobium sp. 32-62-53]